MSRREARRPRRASARPSLAAHAHAPGGTPVGAALAELAARRRARRARAGARRGAAASAPPAASSSSAGSRDLGARRSRDRRGSCRGSSGSGALRYAEPTRSRGDALVRITDPLATPELGWHSARSAPTAPSRPAPASRSRSSTAASTSAHPEFAGAPGHRRCSTRSRLVGRRRRVPRHRRRLDRGRRGQRRRRGGRLPAALCASGTRCPRDLPTRRRDRRGSRPRSRAGPSVINLSLGGAARLAGRVATAILRAVGAGSLVVAAGGQRARARATRRSTRPASRTSSPSARPSRTSAVRLLVARARPSTSSRRASDIPVAATRRRPGARTARSTARASRRRWSSAAAAWVWTVAARADVDAARATSCARARRDVGAGRLRRRAPASGMLDIPAALAGRRRRATRRSRTTTSPGRGRRPLRRAEAADVRRGRASRAALDGAEDPATSTASRSRRGARLTVTVHADRERRRRRSSARPRGPSPSTRDRLAVSRLARRGAPRSSRCTNRGAGRGRLPPRAPGSSARREPELRGRRSGASPLPHGADGRVLDRRRRADVRLAHAHRDALGREAREQRVRERGGERLEQVVRPRRPRPRGRTPRRRGSRRRPRAGRELPASAHLELDVEEERWPLLALLVEHAVAAVQLEPAQLDDLMPRRRRAAAVSASTCSRTSWTRKIDAPRSNAATAAPTDAASVPVRRLRVAEQPAERALPREPDEHRPAERERARRAARTSSRFCAERLAEADARGRGRSRSSAIPADDRERRAAPRGTPPPPRRRRRSAGRACIVRGSPCMCIRQRYASAVGDDAGELRVAAQRRDVVDELGAELERAPRHLGLRRVDRDGHAPAAARARARPGAAPRRARRPRSPAASTRRRRRRSPRPRRASAAPPRPRRRGSRCTPPSEKLSGVTFTIPITAGRRKRSSSGGTSHRAMESSAARPQRPADGARRARVALGRRRGRLARATSLGRAPARAGRRDALIDILFSLYLV